MSYILFLAGLLNPSQLARIKDSSSQPAFGTDPYPNCMVVWLKPLDAAGLSYLQFPVMFGSCPFVWHCICNTIVFTCKFAFRMYTKRATTAFRYYYVHCSSVSFLLAVVLVSVKLKEWMNQHETEVVFREAFKLWKWRPSIVMQQKKKTHTGQHCEH